MGIAAFGIIILLATIVLPSFVSAGTHRSGGTVDLPAGQTVTGDLNILAGDSTIAGTVTGDLSVAAASLDLSGTVQGSLNVAAGDVTITGTIARSARIAGGDVEIRGAIDGDLIVLGGRVTIPSSASIGGDLMIAGGQVNMRGTVTGTTNITSADITLAATLQDDVKLSGSSIDILGSTNIAGDLSYTSASEADIANTASITGTTTQQQPASIVSGRKDIFNPWLRVIWALIAGAIVIAIAPRAMTAIAQNGRDILPAVGVGILALIAVPVVSVALMVTVVGLPIGTILLALFVIALYLTQVAVGTAIGRLILTKRWDDGSRGFLLLCMVLGVLIISGIRFIPVPYIWGGVNVVVTIWGFGAIMMLLGRLRPTSAQEERYDAVYGS